MRNRALNYSGAGLLTWGALAAIVFVILNWLVATARSQLAVAPSWDPFTEGDYILLFAFSIAVVAVDHLYAIRNALVKPGDLERDLEAARAYFAGKQGKR